MFINEGQPPGHGIIGNQAIRMHQIRQNHANTRRASMAHSTTENPYATVVHDARKLTPTKDQKKPHSRNMLEVRTMTSLGK